MSRTPAQRRRQARILAAVVSCFLVILIFAAGFLSGVLYERLKTPGFTVIDIQLETL